MGCRRRQAVTGGFCLSEPLREIESLHRLRRSPSLLQGRLWVRSNREKFGPLWDVWIHILGIGAECACWKAGGPVCRPTREVVGTCPLIRPLRGHLPPRGKAYEQPGAPPLRRIVGEKRRAHGVRPYKRGGGNLPPHPPQCAHWGTCPYPLCPFGTSSLPLLAFGHFPPTGGIGPLTRGVGPQGEGLGKTKRDRSGTCPLKHRGEAELRTKFLCLLSFSKKGGDPAPPRRVRFLI